MTSTETSEQITEKQRGFWLSAFLVLMFIANPLTAITYFANPQAITEIYPSASTGILYFLGLMSLVNVVLAVMIWRWQKLGVYGFYCVIAIGFVINLYIGIGVMGSLTGLLGGVLVFVTTKKRWEHFS
ncbi:hypothetical protein K0I63_16445 [Shewanella rhizosphaerae]|uniref:hypothetical protein n=1 Tax=Shewanella rhizosphaerae TaxID=2864207 RepID=UPI001C659514|nr:hypothetical protein [Shewanella rhizosphaerae]QYK12312.1 hypothetical protein K0I63_16445 [Shewanella rhizosphaerae]